MELFRRLILSMVFLMYGFIGFSQGTSACDCLCDFEYLKSYVEKNHPGFADQVPAPRLKEWERHADSIRNLIKQKEKPCLPLLRAFTAFLRDRHMSVGISSEVEKNQTTLELIKKQEGFDKHERILLSEVEIEAIRTKPYEAIEGIYRNADSGYTVAMIPDIKSEGNYLGVIVSSKTPLWEQGQVKWKAKKEGNGWVVSFWLRYFEKSQSLWDGNTNNPIQGIFFKEAYWQNLKVTKEKTGSEEVENHPFNHRFINDSIAYLQIPSFGGELYRRFVKAYQEVLPKMEKYPYWIIDIRGNGGGSDQCLQPLIPYLYTDTIWNDVLDIFVTPDNIIRHTEFLAYMEKNKADFSPSTIGWWAAENKRMHAAQPFTYLPRGPNKRTPSTYKEVKPNPRKVVLMYDRGSASSAETLIFTGRESAKVVSFGENSFGATGYGEVGSYILPGGLYQLNIPMTRYRYQGEFDTIGIPPMVRAETGKDWIEQVLPLFR